MTYFFLHVIVICEQQYSLLFGILDYFIHSQILTIRVAKSEKVVEILYIYMYFKIKYDIFEVN